MRLCGSVVTERKIPPVIEPRPPISHLMTLLALNFASKCLVVVARTSAWRCVMCKRWSSVFWETCFLGDLRTLHGPVYGYPRTGCGVWLTYTRPVSPHSSRSHWPTWMAGIEEEEMAATSGPRAAAARRNLWMKRARTPLSLSPSLSLLLAHSQSYGELVVEEDRARPVSIAWHGLAWAPFRSLSHCSRWKPHRPVGHGVPRAFSSLQNTPLPWGQGWTVWVYRG
jgi:hypothetical protein